MVDHELLVTRRAIPSQTSHVWVERAPLLRLFLVSAAALYLEIVLIRWISTEVRVFAFFQNLALIACFLGFGLGCYRSNDRGSLLPLVATCVLIVTVNLPLQPWRVALQNLSAFLTMSPDAALWGPDITLTPTRFWIHFAVSASLLACFLLLLVISMVPLGRWVGYYLDGARDAVSAYSVNLAGSIAGMWLLAVVSFAWLPPAYWFAIAFFLVLVAQPISWKYALAAAVLLAVTVVFLNLPGGGEIYWSPYQKLEVTSHRNGQYQIDVNNSGYMSIANVSADSLARDPDLASRYQDSSYDSPFRFADRRDRVLIVGAGAGNDVAAALRNGAGRVDAIEIDPTIYFVGSRLHPERPYSSSKVNVVINDARNFLRQSREQYDVIVFALLDSHTEFSAYSNMRVDNYVYTEEAFREAKRLLKPRGILVLKFEVREPWLWIGQRFFSMLEHIFQRSPVTYYAPAIGGLFSATVFIASDAPGLWQKAAEPPLATFLEQHAPSFALSSLGAPPPTTDDWPYVYHHGRYIPRTYITVSLILLLISVIMVRPVFDMKDSRTWYFFMLGAGFLLLETQLISRLALYFGSTWVVNCIAITFILSVLLLANLYVERRNPANLAVYYALLLSALLVNYAIPWHSLPGSARTIGLLLSAAYCVPLFSAGVIFTQSLRRSFRPSAAFAANILGAVAGGLAQNLAFITGVKALLLVGCVFYGIAIACNSIRGTHPVASKLA
jgi:spermidine synthase